MQTDNQVVSQLNLPDVTISVMAGSWPSRFERTFSSPHHLLAMYLSPISAAEGRYTEDYCDAYSPIGSVFFRPANLHLNTRGRAGPTRSIHCAIDEARLDALGVTDRGWSHEMLQSALDIRAGHLRPYFIRLFSEVTNPGIASSAVVDSLLFVMLADLFNYLADTRAQDVESRSFQKQTLSRVTDRIGDVWNVIPTVAELAVLAGISERHLLRLFQRQFGMSLADYIRQTRLEKARQLLVASDLPLKEIAYRLGFGSHATFTTAFGREMNVTPTQYRRDHRRSYAVSTPVGRLCGRAAKE